MTYEDKIINGECRCEYDSLAELADAAKQRRTGKISESLLKTSDWYAASFANALEMARHGWHEQLDSALEIAESALEIASKEHMMDVFTPTWDVRGAEVDVARYLSGEPECMIDFPLAKTGKQGRVITLCASIGYSVSVSADTIIRRGQVIVAFALALSRLGHSIELWTNSHSGSAGLLRPCEISVKVKGVDDELDPAAIMFAYAHPAMLRRLVFAVMESMPGKWKRPNNNGQAGPPLRPTERELPDGTIVLPELYSDRDVPDADEFLRKYLGELGLLAE